LYSLKRDKFPRFNDPEIGVNEATNTSLEKNRVKDLTMKTEQQQTINYNKLQKRLRRNVGNAIVDYNMIEDGDVVMTCLSGGKDSFVMLDILLQLQKSAPVNFELIAVNLDQKQPGFPEHILPEYLEKLAVPFYIIDKDTYSVVKSKIPEGKTTCGLCSRLRRGTLYSFAETIGATKIALGHHRDDMVETLFLNMFYGSRLKSMPPKLRSNDGRNVVIRPLAYCKEKDLIALAEHREFPIIPCNLCGSQENLQRQSIKAMLQDWEKQHPGRVENIFRSMQNISPSQLADVNLFDFDHLPISREGEKASYSYQGPVVSSSNIQTGVQIIDASLVE
jgi:tRNA 2-thiocytidine biosynthesis protein TtcA|tara:strand:- start:2142 stop:3143 length:1002 start_codon:yes stop_codon:yes gene_type:complete